MSNKTDRQHWEQHHASAVFRIAPCSDIIRRWIESFVPPDCNKAHSCIEIGCCPGRYLAVAGELGYELSGVDFAENIELMTEWLRNCNYRVGKFWRGDFFSIDYARTFDLVLSFGFVEHFSNWREVLLRHTDLVASNGLLLVEAPNFMGRFQRLIHYHLDRANFDRHHIPAMDVEAWSSILRDAGFEILFEGYFGRFNYWVEAQPRTFLQRAALSVLQRLRSPLRRILPPDRKLYSPVCGIVARRIGR